MQIQSQLNDLKTIKFQIPGKIYYCENPGLPHDPGSYRYVSDVAINGTPDDIRDMLNIIFTYFNGEDPGVLFQVDLKYPWLRSMSVGDVVVLGENAWRCESVGWSDFDISELPRESMHG